MTAEQTNISEEFCKGLYLFKCNIGHSIQTLKCIETGTSSLEDFDIILLNSFPYPVKEECVYSFSLSNQFCYSYVFNYEKEFFSIVIHATKLIPAIYMQFLSECKESFHEAPSPPDVRLDLLWSLIQSWKIENNHFNVRFPRSHMILPFNIKLWCFEHFSVDIIPDSINLLDLWHSLLIRSPIFITANSAEVLSKVVFAVISLISPFPYRDHILICTSPDDDRLSNIGSYDIVATLGSEPIKAPPPVISFCVPSIVETDRRTQQHFIFDKTCRLEAIILELIDNALLSNPYADALNYPFVTDSLDEFVRNKKTLFSIDDFRLFEKTWTLRKWRYAIRFRDSFRNAFLSFDPITALRGQSLQHLLQIQQFLDNLISNISNDAHFISVINLHRSYLNVLLTEHSKEAVKAPEPVVQKKEIDKNSPIKERLIEIRSRPRSSADFEFEHEFEGLDGGENDENDSISRAQAIYSLDATQDVRDSFVKS